jgi:D-beta-D-heptose 7-phosphate kinase/D-beta-D-heptose 1-phosphate adenosyltransferase
MDTQKDKKIVKVAASGYFNPLHKGHVEYLEKAKELGDYLVVIVNSDKQRELKRSKEFMHEEERMLIVSALRCVDEVILSIDEDTTVCNSLRLVQPDIFAKGGDRTIDEIPESKVCNEIGAKMVDGLGDKVQSSSWLLKIKD